MSEPRLNKSVLAVGRKGTGKTTIAWKLAAASGKKICVIDTDDHPFYREHDFNDVDTDYLPKWKSGNIRIITSEPEAALQALNKTSSNAFIILEDAAKYISGNIGTAVRGFIIDHRKRNFDVLFMFHFLGDIPPYLAKQYDYMILFKTGDNLDVKQNKFANWHVIEAAARKVLKHGNYNYNITIRIDQ